MPWIRKPADTGLWDVTELSAAPITSGRLLVQRVDSMLFIIADILKLGDATGRVDILPMGGLPVGMRPKVSMWLNVITWAGQLRNAAVSPHGWVPIYGCQPGDEFKFTLTIPTPGRMPVSMPGVKL